MKLDMNLLLLDLQLLIYRSRLQAASAFKDLLIPKDGVN